MEILKEISSYIDDGNFEKAEILCKQLLSDIEHKADKSENTYLVLFNLASFFVDLGHMSKKTNLSRKGLDLMTNYQEIFLEFVPASDFFYNYANAKSNFISVEDPFDLSFKNIEELVEVKNYFWKAVKNNLKEGSKSLKLLVNLSTALKRQFRLSESLRYYDIVNSQGLDIPQAQVNRSDTLKILKRVSNNYSVKMLQEVIDGYKLASKSKSIPVSWSEYYEKLSLSHQDQLIKMGLAVDNIEPEATKQEYENLSGYRKFCVENHLTLSEHSLYCACAGSARDNLTIPLMHCSIGGEFIPKMEMVLNRLKSEFSLARRNYFEYFHPSQVDIELLHEDCFTELLNSELLGIPVEKLRTSFRLCFGILDKIALAICELYEIKPNGQIYFHNFWRLNDDGRRDMFEAIKNPGLLALYSIATDLNIHKNGEWACFKDWRNSLEHGFFIVLDNEYSSDPYESFSTSKEIEKIALKEFLYFLEQMLQLTRSAIFSFVFSVRNIAMQDDSVGGMHCELDRKNFNDSDLNA